MNRPMMNRRTMRDMARGRNPYGSAGGYVVSSRRGRRDRAMNEDMARGMNRGGRGGNRGSNDYGSYGAEYDSRMDYDYGTGEYNTRDGVYGRELYGYYGDTPFSIKRGYSMGDGNMDYGDYGEMDYARGGRGRDRNMDYGYDYGYDRRRDYRYDYAYEDYGENLTKEELEHWRKKLEKEVGDEQSKNFFKKENIEQKARQMGIEMKHFNAEELALASYMLYSDYCKSLKPYVGQNMDIFIKMGEEFLNDPDSAVKGGEKLALYHDMVSGEED